MNDDVLMLVNKGEMLPLMEEFYTIQGEGFYKGTAAYFVRIGGCDVGCHWCDVKESWNADLHPPTHANLIVENAKKYAPYKPIPSTPESICPSNPPNGVINAKTNMRPKNRHLLTPTESKKSENTIVTGTL